MSSIDTDDVLVPKGVRALVRPGVTLIPAPTVVQPKPALKGAPAPPPSSTATAHPAQPVAATGPAASSGDDTVLVPPGVRSPLPRSGTTYQRAASAAPSASQPSAPIPSPATARNPGQPSSALTSPLRRLTDVAPPEGLPEEEGARAEAYGIIEAIKDAVEQAHLGEAAHNADRLWRSWVQANWIGAPFTLTQLQAALSLARTSTFYPFGKGAATAFRRANPLGTPNPFRQEYIGGGAAARLIRRARAINLELSTVSDGAAIVTLEGALSATGLALAIVDYSALYNVPYAGEYIGAGNPADAIGALFSPG